MILCSDLLTSTPLKKTGVMNKSKISFVFDFERVNSRHDDSKNTG
jgi:hypothetical protein